MESLLSLLKNGVSDEEKNNFHLKNLHFGEGNEDWRGNICGYAMPQPFRSMFKEGSGGELRTKARAIHSSSMLAYNFFHWIDDEHQLVLDGVAYSKVYFEIRLPCIKSSRANMDVVLVSTDGKTVLFIESKFTEHLSTRSTQMQKMSSAYMSPASYYAGADRWIDLIEKFKQKSKVGGRYFDGIKQEICHLIALDALRNSGVARFNKLNEKVGLHLCGDEEIRFANIVFKPKECKESNRYEDYKRLSDEFHEHIGSQGVSIKLMTYGEIMPTVTMSAKREVVEFLKRRYIDYAAPVNN